MKYTPTIVALFAACMCTACGPRDGDPKIVDDPYETKRDDGENCTSDVWCEGGTCMSDGAGWTGGYCTTLDCADDGCNGDGAVCVRTSQESTMCVRTCRSQNDCRDGYRCGEAGRSGAEDVTACIPNLESGPLPGEVGAACGADEECDGDAVCDTSLPGGYCLLEDCGTDCPDGSACLSLPDREATHCTDVCSETIDCRIGYRCALVGMQSACVPAEGIATDVTFEDTRRALELVCDAEEIGASGDETAYEMSFTLPEDATSFMLVPSVSSGRLRPTALRVQGADTIDLVAEYRHHNTRIAEFGLYEPGSVGTYAAISFDWPILFPYAPRFDEVVVPGAEYTLELTTEDAAPCIYVMSASDAGVRVDLNVYLVGVDGLSAKSAASDPDLRAVLDGVDTTLGDVGVRIGGVRFVDAPREIAERYSVVRSQLDVTNLTATGAPADATLDGHLGVDVFLVRDITIEGSGFVLGMSASIPGPPGMHGNGGNGLVFRTADLGSDNAHVAHIMAHELAHYLGLRHTTEILHGSDTDAEREFEAVIGTTDPIEDTPVCSNVLYLGDQCPDYTNLMFPAAPPPGSPVEPSLTEGQASVLRANPVVTPE